MDIGKLRTDTAKETGGAWVTLIEGEPGQICVGRIPNARWEAMLRKQALGDQRANRIQGYFDAAEDPLALERQVEMIVQTVLFDWSDLTDGDEVVVFSKEKAREWLTNIPDFRALVMAHASDRANFLEDSAKNLDGSCDGLPNGASTPPISTDSVSSA